MAEHSVDVLLSRKMARRRRSVTVVGVGIAGASRSAGFRGNKAALPSKPCAGCGLAMSWRRRWAKNWAHVKYCSEACRRHKAVHG
jgi:hypothetical protein